MEQNEIKGGGASEGITEGLSNDLNVITAEINAYLRVAGEAIFEIGKRLKHVKENDLAHGEWTRWLKENFNYSHEHARRFIKVFERFSKSTPEWSSLPNSVTVLYELTSFTDEELEKQREMPDGSTKKLTEMSRREIEEFKAREKKAIEEKEKALIAADEANSRAKLAESRAQQAERSESIAKKQLEELEQREPEIEVRTEYVEVPLRDESLEQRLKMYEEKFGDIANYSDRHSATNIQEITTSVMIFSKAVRDLAKRHAYLIQYQHVIGSLDEVTSKEYNDAVSALHELARDFKITTTKAEVINAEYKIV